MASGSEARLGFADEFPRGAVQSLRQPEHGVQAGVPEPALHEADIGGVAGSFGRKSFLRHAGRLPAAANDVAEKLRCGGCIHKATVGDGDYCQNRQ